jgi:spoIIIJ-associated protein
VEVLEESSRGFLGIVGQRDAHIKVRKRDILKEVLEAGGSVAGAGSRKWSSSDQGMQADALEESTGLLRGPGQECDAPSTEMSDASKSAQAILQGILERMPFKAEIRSEILGNRIYLEIKGDGSGILIGKKGQTLDALQYLVSKAVNKDNPPGSKAEVIVDSENYRRRKEENLRQKALKISVRAKKSLKPVSFEPMPPDERRIIHMILAEDREVYTKSQGEGAMRRIVVYPRRTANKRRSR